MSQNTARQYPHRKSEDEDVTAPAARQPEHRDEGEFQLVGDDDLGAADLGPAAPGAVDPDADSERIRKIAP